MIVCRLSGSNQDTKKGGGACKLCYRGIDLNCATLQGWTKGCLFWIVFSAVPHTPRHLAVVGRVSNISAKRSERKQQQMVKRNKNTKHIFNERNQTSFCLWLIPEKLFYPGSKEWKKSPHKNILLCLSTSPPVWLECFEALVLCSLTNIQNYAGSKCCFPTTPMASTATRPSAIFHVFKRTPQWLSHVLGDLAQNDLNWTLLFDSVALEKRFVMQNGSHKISVRSCWSYYWLQSVYAVFFCLRKEEINKCGIHKGFRGVVTNAGCVWMCVLVLVFLCLRLALAWRGREDWSERSGLMSAGHWAHGSVASDCHHRSALAPLWHAPAPPPACLPIPTAPPPHHLLRFPPLPSTTPLSVLASVCLSF